MSLDTVVEEVREDARDEAGEITAEAEAEAEEIVADAEAEAEEIVTEAERAVEREIEQLREQAVSSATLSGKQERLEARRDALESVRDAVEDRLAGLDDDRRETLTRSLVDAGLEEFDAGPVRVRGRADDAELLDAIAGDVSSDLDLEVADPHDCLGGVVLESDATRVRVDNTFDSVLESVWDDELQAVSERLFD